MSAPRRDVGGEEQRPRPQGVLLGGGPGEHREHDHGSDGDEHGNREERQALDREGRV
jgi:hypothetical protein